MALRWIGAAVTTVTLVLGLAALSSGQEGDEAEAAALAAAESWLAWVDEGDYEGSWQEAASLLKNAVSAEQWERQAGAARSPLGAVLSRELRSSRPMTELPGAPDGDYVVLEFTTRFEHKASAVETVTPMLEDGAWKVAGYYVR